MTAMAAMLSITGLGVAQKNVQAANAKDESWSFSLSVNSNAFQYIKGRNKTDDSKIYINWSSTYGGNISQIQVYACGSNSEYGEPINASRKNQGIIQSMDLCMEQVNIRLQVMYMNKDCHMHAQV
mgnify:CR=1 FL=1